MGDAAIASFFGAKYYEPGDTGVKTADPTDPYYYETYVGTHKVSIAAGDCAYWISKDKTTAHLSRGPVQIESPHFATVIRGFAPENKSSTFTNKTVLPYINGCSTKQIFPPDRPGDPTLQMLHIPPYTAEQVHHIHSTVRAVYVVSGEGRSVVGMDKKTATFILRPGVVCILERMCPHHFETEDSSLVVLPVHVWSSVSSIENNHPMFNGTHKI